MAQTIKWKRTGPYTQESVDGRFLIEKNDLGRYDAYYIENGQRLGISSATAAYILKRRIQNYTENIVKSFAE